MKREDLKALELSDEVIEKVMSLHGKTVEGVKNDLTNTKNELGTLKTQLSEANTKIESFKGMKTQEEVDAAVNEYKTKYEAAKTEHQKELDRIKFDTALDKTLKESHKAKDSLSVRGHLKVDNLKLTEEGI